jgi:hypothetical protein
MGSSGDRASVFLGSMSLQNVYKILMAGNVYCKLLQENILLQQLEWSALQAYEELDRLLP